MRVLILSIILIICVQGFLFASDAHLQSESISANQPAKKVFYSKGKGVFGLITGLTLGPVGYATVCIFSHNRITRKKALLGMEIWTGIVLSGLLILLIAKSGAFKGSGSKSSNNSAPNINVGDLGTGSHKHKRKKVKLSAIIAPHSS